MFRRQKGQFLVPAHVYRHGRTIVMNKLNRPSQRRVYLDYLSTILLDWFPWYDGCVFARNWIIYEWADDLVNLPRHAMSRDVDAYFYLHRVSAATVDQNDLLFVHVVYRRRV